MIDEPELSMNVVWQRNFSQGLCSASSSLRKFDVLNRHALAADYHDKWDWWCTLGEEGGRLMHAGNDDAPR